MILDLNMWKNQIFYSPHVYGQYLDSEDHIITVRDNYSLANHNETYMNFEYRNSTINPLTNLTYIQGDMIMNSRWYGYALAIKCTAFIPSMMAFICFGISVWYVGRWKPTVEDPHGGRLKKRKRLRFSERFRFRRSSKRAAEKKRAAAALQAMTVFKESGDTVIFEITEGKDYVQLKMDDNNANGITKVTGHPVDGSEDMNGIDPLEQNI